MRCLCKVGLPLQLKTGNQLSSPDDMRCTQLSSRLFTEIDVLLDLRWGVSRNLWIFVKDVKSLVYDVERGMAMEPMQGKCASF